VTSPLSLPSPFRCHSPSKKQRNPLMKKIPGLQAPMELTPHKFLIYHFFICQDVPSTMYYFLKDKGWYNLHLGNVAECQLVFNHHRKSLKTGAGWKQFCQILSLDAGMEIVFEFINPCVNRILYWLCSIDEMCYD